MGIIVDNEPVPVVSCGDFSCSTGWTAKPDWTIAAGVAVVVESGIVKGKPFESGGWVCEVCRGKGEDRLPQAGGNWYGSGLVILGDLGSNN